MQINLSEEARAQLKDLVRAIDANTAALNRANRAAVEQKRSQR